MFIMYILWAISYDSVDNKKCTRPFFPRMQYYHMNKYCWMNQYHLAEHIEVEFMESQINNVRRKSYITFQDT